jgi:NAD(P)-dependent dehydrogenase (short-subunit alcohol dehydrogenase family)
LSEELDVSGRRILISGASRGIGFEVARILAEGGHRPVGLARTAPSDFPGEFDEVDLADREATDRAVARVLRSGEIDGLVNNIGLVRPARLGSVRLQDLDAVYDLNVRTALQLTQGVLDGMVQRGWGRIVNISSLVTTGWPDRTSYGAAKAALDFFARAWAGELATTGVTVNAVAPGPTETALFRESNPVGSPSEQRYLRGIPSRRLGRPAEIAAAVCFLLSDEASYITGQTLRVDGGGSVHVSADGSDVP